MSPPRNRQAPTPPVEPDSDPLAALRDPEETGVASVQLAEVAEPEPLALVTQAEQERLRHLAVLAMHEDLTVQGFVHGGGVCGCWYISGVILRAVAPVQANTEAEPEPEPAEG